MNVGDLTAKLKLDTARFDNAIGGVTGSIGKLASGVTSTLGTVTAAVGTAVAGAATAIGSVVEQAVKGFANYEQLVGGSKLVFGDAYDYIMDKSVEAYKNVGLSQSQYLEQVNGFAVGLKEALGGSEQAAAELADRIVTAEADVVAAMGISQEAAQNAFNGIMKGNFTMVDNLMLGIKPTKEGFQEMIDKVNEWNATQGRATQYTMDNVADMQSALVDYIEMQGLAGYAANEASDTISGAFNMVKAAWQDVLISIAGGGKGLEQSIADLVEAAEALLKNVIPVVEEAMYGIGDLIQGIVPIIAERLPELISQLVPVLLDAAMALVSALTSSLPDLVSSISRSLMRLLPQFMQTVSDLLNSLIGDIIPLLIAFGGQLIVSLANGIAENAQQMANALIYLISYMLQVLSDALPQIIIAGTAIIAALAQSFADNSSMIIAGIVQLINVVLTAIIENWPTIYMAGMQIILGLVEGLVQNINLITDTIMQLIALIPQVISEHLEEIVMAALQIGLAIVKGILLAIPSLLVSIGRVLGIVDEADRGVGTMTGNMAMSVSDMATNVDMEITGINDTLGNLSANVASTRSGVTSSATSMGQEVKKVTVPIYDSMGQLVGQFETTQTVAKSASKSIADSTKSAQNESKSSTDKILEDNAKIEQSFKKLNSTTVRPEVDASKVVEGCSAIVTAVDEALKALEKLANASSSARGASLSLSGYRAGGGPVMEGQAYMTGELGREIFIPSTNGYVMNHDDTEDLLDGFGSGRQVVININGDVYDDEYSMKRKLKTAVIDIIDEQVAYG